MALTIIPVSQEPNQRFQITLTGVTYFIVLKFNQLMDLWTIALADANNEQIFGARPVLPGTNLLRFTDKQSVPGVFLIAFRNTDEEVDPDFDRLIDGRVTLYYGDTV